MRVTLVLMRGLPFLSGPVVNLVELVLFTRRNMRMMLRMMKRMLSKQVL